MRSGAIGLSLILVPFTSRSRFLLQISMPASLAFQVDQYDEQNWEQHTRLVEKDIPEPGKGEVLGADIPSTG